MQIDNGNIHRHGLLEPLSESPQTHYHQDQPPKLILGGLEELRQELGGKISLTYCSALKKAAGITTRKFDVSRAIRYLKTNPEFTISVGYPSRLRSRINQRQ